MEHLGSQVMGGGGCGMKIANHGPRLPATNEPNADGVNVGTKKGHGTTGPKGPGTDVRRCEAQ